MEIFDYFTAEDKEHWRGEIAKADWRAAAFLLELLADPRRLGELLGETKLYLLTENGSLAAFATLSEQDSIRDESLRPWIGFVYTFSQFRGRRLSEKLMRFAERQAAAEGAQKVYVCTDHIGLYEKYGYRYEESREDYWGEISRIYSKNLGGQSR